VEQDRVRLPEDEAVVVERRHLSIGIDRDVLGGVVITMTEIDRHELAVDREVVLEGDDAERTRGRREEIEAHGSMLSTEEPLDPREEECPAALVSTAALV